MKDSTAQNLRSPHNLLDVVEPHQPRRNNIIKFVATPKKTKSSPLPEALSKIGLIELTEKLAADAKSGKLKGLCCFAEYPDGYTFGLEGSYLLNPGAVALPLLHLQHRLMQQIDEAE